MAKRIFEVGRRLAVAALVMGSADAVDAQSSAVTVPLHIHDGRLWVPVESESGEAFRFLVSTGNAMSVLSERGAERVRGAGPLYIGGSPTLSIDMTDVVEGSDENFHFEGETFDGLIAPNTLNRWDLLLDAPAGRMLFAPIGRPVEWDGYELSDPVRLRIYHGVAISLQVELSGTPTPAMLEIGAPRLYGNEAVGEMGGIVEERAPELRIGGAAWTDLPARVEELSVIRRFSPSGEPFVMVGGVIALDCVLALSYVHQELRTCVR